MSENPPFEQNESLPAFDFDRPSTPTRPPADAAHAGESNEAQALSIRGIRTCMSDASPASLSVAGLPGACWMIGSTR